MLSPNRTVCGEPSALPEIHAADHQVAVLAQNFGTHCVALCLNKGPSEFLHHTHRITNLLSVRRSGLNEARTWPALPLSAFLVVVRGLHHLPHRMNGAQNEGCA